MTNDPKNTQESGQEKPEEPKKLEIIGGGANSYTAKMMRQLAETAPVVSSELDLSELPAAELPNLSSITVQVPPFPEITEQDVMARFELIYYDTCVERSLRTVGEAVEMGDELLLDLVGYVNGQIMPFSAQENLRIRLEPDSIQPGVGKALAGAPVGETKTVAVDVPQDNGNPIKVAFVIDIKKAASLTFPKPEDPATLKALGMGDTLDDVYGAIARSLSQERDGVMLAQCMGLALEAVAAAVDIEISDELIDTEIRSQWTRNEGRFLMDKGASRKDMDDAVEAWLRDENTRNVARERLKIAAIMMLYTIQDPSELTPEEVEGFFADYAKRNNIDYDKWRGSLAGKEEDQEALLNEYLYLRTVTHITSEVNLQFT